MRAKSRTWQPLNRSKNKNSTLYDSITKASASRIAFSVRAMCCCFLFLVLIRSRNSISMSTSMNSRFLESKNNNWIWFIFYEWMFVECETMQFMFLNMMVHTETGWICVGYVFQSCQIKVPITMYTRRANVAMEHHVLAVCVCIWWNDSSQSLYTTISKF